MWHRAFLNRLRKELPDWVERGFLAPDQQAAILEHVAARAAGQVRMAPVALAVLGALTFGTGVITFFAANWDAMAKALKLALLFGGMWGAYGLGAYGLAAEGRGARVLGQAMALLGVVLFGASIILIAQIYHIDSHYPNGILMWALGALAVAWVAPVQPVAVAGLALAILWSGMEIFDFDHLVHWPFLVVWALFLAPIVQRSWRYGAGAALLALILWCAVTLLLWSNERRGEVMFLLQLYLLLAMAFYILAAAMDSRPRWQPLAGVVRRFALIAVLLCGHAFVYEDLHGLRRSWWLADPETELVGREIVQWLWVVGTIVVMAATFVLAAWQLRARGGGRLDALGRSGLGLLAALCLLMVANLFLPAHYGAVTALYVAFNLVTFSALVWLIVAGYRAADHFQVNWAFVFFALGLLALYFDRFYTLMDRSLFFMGGGALLLVGGYLLERQRRRLVGRMAGPQDGGRR